MPVSAQSLPVLRLVSSPVSVGVGQTISVSFEILNISELYGFDVSLTIDPAKVELISISQGTFLDPGFALVNQVTPANGTAQLALTQLNPSTPKSGGGGLITLVLKGKSAGVSSVIFTNVDLVRADGSFMQVDPQNGQVIVTTNPQVFTPTLTATKSMTPTITRTPTRTRTPFSYPTSSNVTATPNAGPGNKSATPTITKTGIPLSTIAPTLAGQLIYPRNYQSPTPETASPPVLTNTQVPTTKPTLTATPTLIPLPVTGDKQPMDLGSLWWFLLILLILLILLFAYGIWRNMKKAKPNPNL